MTTLFNKSPPCFVTNRTYSLASPSPASRRTRSGGEFGRMVKAFGMKWSMHPDESAFEPEKSLEALFWMRFINQFTSPSVMDANPLYDRGA